MKVLILHFHHAGVAELVDARDSKSRFLWKCGFDSLHPHHNFIGYFNVLCEKYINWFSPFEVWRLRLIVPEYD